MNVKMGTKDKLREALGNMFKARGEIIETKKPQQKQVTTSSSEGNNKKEHLNGGLKDNGKTHKPKSKLHIKGQNTSSSVGKKHMKKKFPTEKKEAPAKVNGAKPANDSNKFNDKQEKPQLEKTANAQKTMNNNKTNKKNEMKSSKDKKFQSTTKDETSKRPPGYFVMNHTNSKSKKNSSSLNEKPNAAVKQQKNKKRVSEKNETKAKPPVQAKKRKANKDNGPQSKVYKKPNEQFDSEASSDNNETSVEGSKALSKFAYSNEDSDEGSYASFMDETDTTEDYNESYDDETLSDDYESDDDEFSFESDDLDDTYSSEQSESDIYFSGSESLNSIHDPDYELPKTVLEDHIVHNGLAVKYDFNAEYDIEFDEHNESAQIVELPNEVNNVEQHESLNAEHLRTLELNYVENVKISKNATSFEESDECPDLVPIEEVDFRIWTSGIEMDDEIFSECTDYNGDSDEESITAAEGNINNKYLNMGDAGSGTDSDENVESSDEEYDEDVDELATQKQQKALDIKADVIVTRPQTVASFKLDEPEKDTNAPLSLSEIIAQTQDLVDMSTVVIKSAVVYDAVWKTTAEIKTNGILDEADDMRVSTDSSAEQAQVSNETILHFADNEALDDSIASDSPQTPVAVFSDESMTDTQTQLEKTAQDSQVQKFRTQFFDSIDSHNVLVLLKSPFYIYGAVKATLIAGSVEVFGYKLEKWKTQQLFSPRGVCALQILPLSKSSNGLESSADAEEILATIGTFSNECEFHPQHLDKLLANFEPSTDAILLLARNDDADNIKRMLQLHVKENIFPAQIPHSRQFYTSEFLLDCMINVNTEYPLHIPPQWYDLRLKFNSKFLLVGGKSVGKSTLLRFLVNQHLNKFPAVLVIDLDIGQPEIFASQAVSCALIQQPLLGPGFLYGIQPDKAYCVAHSNVVLCAHRYLPAVLELLQYCSEQPRYCNIPCIVNTMGYNKGFGAELIAVITEHLRPTDIVQLQSNVPINNFDYHFEPHVVPIIERNIFNRPQYAASNTSALNHHLHLMPSAVLQQGRYQREWQMSAKDMRYIMLLTQLSQILNEHSEILNQKQTYCVDMDKLKITSPLSSLSTPTEVAKSLVSNLVYLGHSDSKSTELNTIECYGIGIVRAIDWPARKLYLLTALPLDRLKRVNAVISGDMPLPASMLTLQNLAAEVDVPFVQNVADEATSRSIRQFYSRTEKK